MKKSIYIYTTNTNRKKGEYKLGETTRTADERIKEQVKTGMSEDPIKIWEGKSFLSDKQIHSELIKLGYVNIIREWYGGFNSDDEIITVVSKIISKSENDTRVEYTPRFFQTIIKNKFLEKYQSEVDKNYEVIDFALELAPRFGKTIWVIDLLKTLFENFKIKLCIIPSYVLTSNSSFEKEFYFFKGYSDKMVIANIDDNLDKTINDNYGNRLIIVPLSLHIREHEEKLEIIKNLPLKDKVAIIDEADFGAHRMNSQGKIDFISCGLNVYMTGTAIEKVIYPLKNVRDNILRWSYHDMLLVKNGEHPTQDGMESIEESENSVKDIVIPQFMRLSLGGVINNFYDVEPKYRTDWSKLFSDVDKSKPVLIDLIKSLFGVYNGKLTYLVDLNTSEICSKDVTMVFANTPDKVQQKKLHKLLEETLGPQYIVELINGDETSNKKAEEIAKGVVSRAKREGKKVVFLSKDMASRSFSVPEIDTVMLMFDRGSYSSVAQKISRVLTPGKTYHNNKKIHGNIISLSLDPNREGVSPIDEYLVYEAEKVEVKELSDGINRVLRSVNIFVNENGLMEPIIIDEYANKLINSSELIRLGMDIVKVDSVINDIELVKVLTGIEINNKEEKEKIDGIDSSTIIRTEKEKSKKDKTQKEVTEDIRQKIKESLSNIVENIVEISEINNCESNNIVETLDMIGNKGYCEEVVFEVGVDCEMVKKIVLLGAVPEKLLNTIITSYNNEENGVIVNKIDSSLSKWKSNPSKGEVFTPKELVNEMLDKIPEEVWKNPKSLFLDPCMGKGTFLIEIVNRLIYNYNYSEEDAKSRVFGYDVRVKYINYLRRRGFINVQCKDFLNEEIKMKFDVIIGNPPYQETDELGKSKTGGANLYTKFIRKSFEIGRYVSFIVPPTWMNSNKDEKDIFSKNQIHYLNITECKKHFNGVGSQFSYFLLEKKEVQSKTKVICEFNKKTYNSEIFLKDFIYLPMLLNELVISVYNKITNSKEKLNVNISFKFDHRQKFISKVENNEFIYKLKHTSKQFRYSSLIHPAQNENKVLISRSGNLSPYYDNGELGTTDGVMWIVVENEIEGQNLINFLNSKLIRFILLVYKWNGFNEVVILKQLPKIDLSVMMTDNEIYNMFGITENEIELIESHVE